MSQITKCQLCSTVITSHFEKCPECGSFKKIVQLTFVDEMCFRDQLKGKAKDHSKTGKKKEMLKFVDGHEQSANGQWVYKNQTVDYSNDLYEEVVIAENGSPLRVVRESLKQHRGRGSAKFNK